MPPKNINIIVKVKKIISVLDKYHIYKFKIGRFSFIWLIKPDGIFAIDKEESFPFIKFKRAAK